MAWIMAGTKVVWVIGSVAMIRRHSTGSNSGTTRTVAPQPTDVSSPTAAPAWNRGMASIMVSPDRRSRTVRI